MKHHGEKTKLHNVLSNLHWIIWIVLLRLIVGMELFHTVDAEETLPPTPNYMKKCHCTQCLQFIVQSWFQVHFCQLQKQMARL